MFQFRNGPIKSPNNQQKILAHIKAKHEVNAPSVPPLIPPQAGGEELPDKSGCYHLWLLLH